MHILFADLCGYFAIFAVSVVSITAKHAKYPQRNAKVELFSQSRDAQGGENDQRP